MHKIILQNIREMTKIITGYICLKRSLTYIHLITMKYDRRILHSMIYSLLLLSGRFSPQNVFCAKFKQTSRKGKLLNSGSELLPQCHPTASNGSGDSW